MTDSRVDLSAEIPEAAATREQLSAFIVELRDIVFQLIAENDRLTKERDRTQHWLEEFQGSAAQETVRCLQLQSRIDKSIHWLVTINRHQPKHMIENTVALVMEALRG